MSEQKFKHVLVSVTTLAGPRLRFTNDRETRSKRLKRDPEFSDLPHPMTEVEAAAYLMGRPGFRTADAKIAIEYLLSRVPNGSQVVQNDRNDRRSTELSDDLLEIADSDRHPTSKRRLVEARLGQGRYRRDVLDLWHGKCAVSRTETAAVIRASHIKPWRSCDDYERLDPHNGLPLVATYDALFDRHLISFDTAGVMMVSSSISADERRLLDLTNKRLSHPIDEGTQAYLSVHRASFKKRRKS